MTDCQALSALVQWSNRTPWRYFKVWRLEAEDTTHRWGVCIESTDLGVSWEESSFDELGRAVAFALNRALADGFI